MVRGRKILLGMILPLSLGAILMFALLQVGGFGQANPITKIPTPSDPVLASLSRQIDQYDKDLKKDLAPDTRQSVQGKKKYLERQATERAEYLSHQDKAWFIKQTAIVEMTLTPPVRGKGMPTVPPGLYVEFSNPRSHEAVFSTLWIVHTAEQYVLYYAGEKYDDPDQGVRYIENRTNGSTKMLYTPRKDGSLKIKDVDKNKITWCQKKVLSISSTWIRRNLSMKPGSLYQKTPSHLFQPILRLDLISTILPSTWLLER